MQLSLGRSLFYDDLRLKCSFRGSAALRISSSDYLTGHPQLQATVWRFPRWLTTSKHFFFARNFGVVQPQQPGWDCRATTATASFCCGGNFQCQFPGFTHFPAKCEQCTAMRGTLWQQPQQGAKPATISATNCCRNRHIWEHRHGGVIADGREPPVLSTAATATHKLPTTSGISSNAFYKKKYFFHL